MLFRAQLRIPVLCESLAADIGRNLTPVFSLLEKGTEASEESLGWHLPSNLVLWHSDQNEFENHIREGAFYRTGWSRLVISFEVGFDVLYQDAQAEIRPSLAPSEEPSVRNRGDVCLDTLKGLYSPR